MKCYTTKILKKHMTTIQAEKSFLTRLSSKIVPEVTLLFSTSLDLFIDIKMVASQIFENYC